MENVSLETFCDMLIGYN